ncbi:MAG: hypothetical protein KGI25_05370 [Thaumarchaeota archaeon]|nr:hypothetical protein [Nitrososphaerota archaeon]
MKTLHISIIIGAGVAAAIALGAITLLSPHMFQYNQQSGMSEAASHLGLAMSLNSTEIKLGQSMGMDISLTNTSPNTVVLDPEHNWPLRKWSMGPCLFHLPFGMALMQGYYTTQNMTDGQRLPLYPTGVYMCKTIGIVDFVFEPSSTKATIETYNSTNYPVTMQYHVGFNGYYDGQKFQSFVPGVYTVVGDDQWGHISIKHFTVTA